MNLFRRKDSSGRKKPLLRREAAGSEHERILLDEAQAHGKQPRGHSFRLGRGFLNFLGGWHRRHRNKEPEDVIHLTETSKGFQQLLQEGQFLQAYLSISESEQEGQDCGPQYQAVAQSMWQVVQQALQGAGHSKELELKLQAVLATVEQAQHKPPGPEAETLEDGGGVAAWGGQLERLLRRDAEARVPRLDPRNQLGPFLEKLGEAVRQGLGSQRASRLGTRLWASYRVCFQEALLGRLAELTQSCGANWKSYCELYTWGKEALFGQLGQESFLNAPSAAPEPTVGHLLDPMMFVTWMSQRQEELVRLTQERLEQALGKVLSCDRRQWAQSSCPTFLEILQLLEETIDAARPIGLTITSQVQAMVLETFSKFLNRYQAEAIRFLQQNAPAGAFPEVHLLRNCCILRKTWQELSQAHVPPADLGPAVEGAIHVIEDHSRDHLLPRVRALCQSLLRDHFGRKDKDLVHAVQSLCQGLRGCPSLHSTPMYEGRALCEVCTWWSLGSTSRPWPPTSGRWRLGSGEASVLRWRGTSRSWTTSSGSTGVLAWTARRNSSWRSSSSARTRAGRL
ncbi:uncharacterized protein LOC120247765 isoform X2 [Hyaena hyaena]|uniref:uncharacterized protein LOC120247765 isoform X2 n=1 Tax=Hyaena hyaena TaxID=95912 RepID=UPI0019242F03|nr:uncharacterized protein LOC120247765 isoform X2 [Hyaena hyaena]